MGANVNQGKGNGPNADLNITPLVDVVLVLLIVFMVATPFAISGVNVQLPKTQMKAMDVSNQKSKEPLVISVTSQGEFFLGKEKLDVALLRPKLVHARNLENEEQIFVRADKGVAYGKVMEAMAEAQLAGFVKIGMIGEAAAPARK